MRWYDPTTGRFTQQDSLETLADPSRSNRYEYAAGNPINYVDPSGMERCWVSPSNGSYWCREQPSADFPKYFCDFVGLFATIVTARAGFATGIVVGTGTGFGCTYLTE